MSKVVLIRPPSKVMGELHATGGNSIPLNLLYVASSTKKDGHDVAVIDFDVEPYTPEDVRARLQFS